MSKFAISHYHAELDKIMQYGGTKKETAIRGAFLNLLNHYCEPKHFLLIPELDYPTKFGTTVFPDGTIKDAMRLDWGWWESKDQDDDLNEEIRKKLLKGYPTDNILFEDSQTAVLIQRGEERLRVSMRDADALDRLLTAFLSYERPEIAEFRKAIELFKTDLPMILARLREIIEEAGQTNAKFCAARDKLLETCRKSINPNVTPLDVREMLIQHILTEDLFLSVFHETQFHRENVVAKELQAVTDTFLVGSFKKNLLVSLDTYYAAIRKEAARISNHHEKQKFLKALYEQFYTTYNPKAADRLGVVYTPNEIVRFMIESADDLVHRHFGKLLADSGVEIIDPATGTGTFITELIDYLPKDALPYKYAQEIHCNEVAILPYYIANLNIEYTYAQKMGAYAEFQNICFVDTLDNMGFWYPEKQGDLFGLGVENSRRIKEQNTRKISVIIGNPPYNANQKNENENNKNRDYPEIDARIKESYVKYSTAQKMKVYDMYARFFRWATDRLAENGVIAFITNSSFLDARGFDGFRKSAQQAFQEIWIVDLGGDLRKQESGNVFGIKIGVAISFMVKDTKQTGPCRIFYTKLAPPTAPEKLEMLQMTPLQQLRFEHLLPDAHSNWLHLVENDFHTHLPVLEKKYATALFALSSNGISTNRDEWVYDFSFKNVKRKARFFLNEYNLEVERWKAYKKANQIKEIPDETNPVVDDFLHARNIIKWSKRIKRDKLRKGKRGTFHLRDIRRTLYRPFTAQYLYFGYIPIDMRGQQDEIFPHADAENYVIAVNHSATQPFHVLAANTLVDLHFTGDTVCLPLYRYAAEPSTGSGQAYTRRDNITDWGLAQFRAHYHTPNPSPNLGEGREDASKTPSPDLGEGAGGVVITKLDIFHYTYAVLHHPAYRQKYELNLKREFPRIPFYADFWQWADWGRRLMELHLNYETVAPYPLTRQDQPLPPTPSPNLGEGAKGVRCKLKADKLNNTIIIDDATSLHGVPAEAWDYKLGNRSALEWVLDQYKEKTPKDPTIKEKFDTYRFADYKEQVIDLLCRVCAVSVETMAIVRQMETVPQTEEM